MEPLTDADVDRLAVMLGLTIDPSSRAAVREHLAGMLAVARLVTDFPLPDDVEAAPIFRP
jgi:hypothetical protein